jgi:glycosyltransferase involved in cell wall biosynthesis
MKILMLAPEPFFQPRGTPISVYFRTKALTALGHDVDLVTYPLGEDVKMAKLRIFRLSNFLRLKKIRIGPSAAKIPLDAALTLKALGRILRSRYDLVYSHEEAAFPGLLLSKLAHIPHLYDMHSSLPQQLENFEFTRSPLL